MTDLSAVAQKYRRALPRPAGRCSMTPTPEQFRAAGFTAGAINYPKPPEAIIALKRFNGLADDAPVPIAWHYFPNAWMRDNWRSVYPIAAAAAAACEAR